MAGMLPGVEAARRRRFHQSSNPMNNYSYGSSDSAFTRRPSICSLYADSTITTHLPSSKYSSTRNVNSSIHHQITSSQSQDESRLGAVAREAKRRLDERLQQYKNRRSSETKRSSSERGPETSTVHYSNPSERPRNQQQVLKVTKSSKKDNLNALRWLKLRSRWKSSSSSSSERHIEEEEDYDGNNDECAVCLEQMAMRSGHRVMQLPCAHRFHTNCLVPWLETNAHCPCCRLEINP